VPCVIGRDLTRPCTDGARELRAELASTELELQIAIERFADLSTGREMLRLALQQLHEAHLEIARLRARLAEARRSPQAQPQAQRQAQYQPIGIAPATGTDTGAGTGTAAGTGTSTGTGTGEGVGREGVHG
jgi:hypothetical protein